MMLRSGRNKAQFAALLVPGIAVFALFTVYPIVKLFVMSFLRWDLGSVFQRSFAGLENYKAVLSDETFFVAFENTLLYTLVTVPGQMALGLLAAVLIHSIPRFRVTFRVIYYIPVITSWVIVSLVFRYIFNTEGMLNYFLCNVLHLTKDYVPWLNTRWGGLTVAMLLGIWKGVGWNLVVFLAALQSVPAELYEAADVDGCTGWKKFWYITLPSIRPTILFALVMLTIGGFNVFTSIKMITDGKPMHQTDTVLTWMYYKAFSTGEFGYAAALSFIVAVTLMVLAFLQFRAMKRQNGLGRGENEKQKKTLESGAPVYPPASGRRGVGHADDLYAVHLAPAERRALRVSAALLPQAQRDHAGKLPVHFRAGEILPEFSQQRHCGPRYDRPCGDHCHGAGVLSGTL